MWVWLSFVLAGLLYVAAAVCAWRAIRTARTPQGAVGWVVFLLAAPYLGVPLFLLFGDRRFRGYIIARTDSTRVVEGLNRFAATHAPVPPVSKPARALERLAHMPIVRGNDLELLIDGDAAFEAIHAAIDAAEHYVLAQFYIIRDDACGQAFAERLKAAAARGVRVHLLFDAIGSNRLSNRYLDDLRAAGVDAVYPERIRGPKSRLALNFRNHRKTLVVDGQVGFTGGMNLGVEYLGQDPAYGPWRDTHVRLTGPIVSQLQLVYLEDWHWATRDLPEDLNWDPVRAEADMNALILASGPGDRTETGAMFFLSMITAAEDRIWIASPYFVPDAEVLSALKHAALRGVEVRILLPESADHWLTWLAAFAYFDEVADAGVEIWRYGEGFMHQKVVLVDGAMFAVGTTNLDNRSFRLNFESMAIFFDPRAAAAGEAMLAADFQRATHLRRPLSAQPAAIRIGAPIARLFSPLL
ncbi:cardiolipin synthase [Palleronia sp. KMU-117]|uniref:cardiolipin synthase n=1 Tax=Palleronia sp. KMU-117 TaxID=3434108 RepID=UPI003D745A1B